MFYAMSLYTFLPPLYRCFSTLYGGFLVKYSAGKGTVTLLSRIVTSLRLHNEVIWVFIQSEQEGNIRCDNSYHEMVTK